MVSTSTSCGCTTIEAGLDNGDGGGTARNGILEPGEVDSTGEVCDEEVGICYAGSFTELVSSTVQQCTDWNDFRAQLTGSFSTVTVTSSLGTTFTCTDPTSATTLCNALQSGGDLSLTCDGEEWYVNTCAAVPTLAVGAHACSLCEGPEFAVRPCYLSTVWGGVDNVTCDAPTQTLEVRCEQ